MPDSTVPIRSRVLPSVFRPEVLLCCFLVSACSPDRPPQETSSPSPSPGTADGVEILIDDQGIPHIYAPNDEDLFFAAGYQMASDRLYQMETLRRFAFGRLAEVLGEAGLYRDIQARTFDFPYWGGLDCALMVTEDPERRMLLDAWVRGINRRVQEILDGQVPLPFGYGPDGWDFLPERWQPEDPCIVLKGAGFALDDTLEFEYAVTLIYSLYPTTMGSVEILKPAHPVFSVPLEDLPESARSGRSASLSQGGKAQEGRRGRPSTPAEPAWMKGLSQEERQKILKDAVQRVLTYPRASGSNNWAIDGRFTENGRPLLAGDPHLSFAFFGAPYPMHLNSADAGGTYNVAGFAYPGTPGISIGFNEHFVWSPTSAFGDVMDIWDIEEDDGSVNVGGQWVPIVPRREEIIVRRPGGPAGEGDIETIDYGEVPGYGVIVPGEVFGSTYLEALLNNWKGFQTRPARWFMELNRVSSLDDFEAAVDRMKEMNYNFIGADATGISLRVGVDVPIREAVTDIMPPWRTMDASDPNTLWTDQVLAREQLPASRAIERGWLATANNDPFGFTADGRIDNDPWFYGAFFDPGYRASRIDAEMERLTGSGTVTLQDMEALQMDVHSVLADDLLPLLADAYTRVGVSPELSDFVGNDSLAALVQLLTVDWDRRMARDSAGALAFNAFAQVLAAEAIRDDILLAYDFSLSLQAIYVMKVAFMALLGQYPDGDDVLQEGRDAIVLNAGAATADFLMDRFGDISTDAFEFGDLKVTRFDHGFGYLMPLFDRPTDGGEDTLCVSQNILFDPEADVWPSYYVSVERMVAGFDADGTPEVWVNFPLGPAADPNSSDTAKANSDYIDGTYHRFLFRRDDIEAVARERRELTPG